MGRVRWYSSDHGITGNGNRWRLAALRRWLLANPLSRFIMENASHFVNQSDPPQALTVLPDAIPAALKDRAQWVVWRYEWRVDKKGDGKWTKPPFNARTARKASSTDPATFSTYAEARNAYKSGQWDGIGYVPLQDEDMAGIDLDECRDSASGAIEEWAARIVAELDSYTEISPSGTGLRIFVQGHRPNRDRAKRGSVEIYDGITREGKQSGRFLTLTGHHLEGTTSEIHPRQERLSAVYLRELCGRKETPAELFKRSTRRERLESPSSNGKPLCDVEIMAHAEADTGKLGRLWRGNHSGYGSQSEADAALCRLLANLTANDRECVERLMGQSVLGQRAKWRERADYRKLTLDCIFIDSNVPNTDGPIPCGSLFLRIDDVMKTSRNVVAGVSVLRNGAVVDHLRIGSGYVSRAEAARNLGRLDRIGQEDAREAVRQVVVAAAALAERQTERSLEARAAGQTVQQTVLANVPADFHADFRTVKEQVWVEALGREVSRDKWIAAVLHHVVDPAMQAINAPRRDEEVSRSGVIHECEAELRVLWGSWTAKLSKGMVREHQAERY